MILDVALPVPVPKTFDYLPPDDLTVGASLVGCRVKVLFGPRFLTGVAVGVKDKSETPSDRLRKISAIVDADPVLDEAALALGRWLSTRYLCSLGEALDALLPPKANKQLSVSYETVEFHGEDSRASFREPGFSLTDEQSVAVQRIHRALYSDPQILVPLPNGEGLGEGIPNLPPMGGGTRALRSKTFLLRGVSAAGKTEVYISAIRDVLAQGKSALYLAPEIGLVDQLAETLRHRFGPQRVCVWHSGCSVKERRDDWWRIKRGEFSIVIGARSAALLPLSNIGVIVMDEEQDSAWKEDRKPRFHARDVVLERARLENAVVLFGSATPSLEILFEAKQGRAELLEMNERAVRASAPRVRLIDMKSAKVRGILSPDLQKAIGDRLQKKEQTILFINRRGFYRYLRCPSCDWMAKCETCGVTLVQHKSVIARRPKADVMTNLVCHYCAQSTAVPLVCPSCGHKKLSSGGTGTERVVEEIKDKFPWARVARWDGDSAKKKGDQEMILRDFQAEETDVLVGTQVVAQGFHFPKVTLVGVVNADTSLHVPDFRAAEHTFQLLMQVAGRAGRDVIAGEVLIQTRHADHPALRCAASLDYQRFSDEELAFRKELFYPPFTHLIKIETAAKDPKKVAKDIDGFVSWVMGKGSSLVAARFDPFPIALLGPTVSKRKRKGLASSHVLLKVQRAQFDDFLTQLRAYLYDKGARFRIDIDPD